FTLEEFAKRGVIASFVFASEDYPKVAWKRIERFQGGIDAGGFGIVIEADSVELGDELQAMLDSFEGLHGACDLRGRNSRDSGGRGGSHYILGVVHTGNRDFGTRHEPLDFAAGEPDCLGRRESRERTACFVVGVQDGVVAGLLTAEEIP